MRRRCSRTKEGNGWSTSAMPTKIAPATNSQTHANSKCYPTSNRPKNHDLSQIIIIKNYIYLFTVSTHKIIFYTSKCFFLGYTPNSDGLYEKKTLIIIFHLLYASFHEEVFLLSYNHGLFNTFLNSYFKSICKSNFEFVDSLACYL